MLIILGAWRHVYRRFPLRYDALYCAYTVCSFRLANAIDAPYLTVIPRTFFYVALGAWLLAMIGLVGRIARHASASKRLGIAL